MTELKQIRTCEPNPALVQHLKDLVARAETGEMQGYVGVYLYDNGTCDDAWVNPPAWWMTDVSTDRVVGALTRVRHKLLMRRCAHPDDWGLPPDFA